MARAAAVQGVEAPPEAERFGDFPHPRETSVLYGHASTERALLTGFASGRMHHAWLLAGRPGIGKATLAYRLARFVLASPSERDASGASLDVAAGAAAARQVIALSHPGLLVLRRAYDPRTKRFSASIPVDEVRRLKTFLGLTGGQDAWRVVIVDSADELNVNAANALLKSLEEPPARALFVIVCSEPGRLLPTIRSRCRRLDLQPLSGDLLRRATGAALAAAEARAPTEEDWRQLEGLAQGSVRRALLLASSGGIQLYERVRAIFMRLPEVDWPAVHALADGLAPAAAEQRFAAFFDLFLDLLARLTRVRATGAGEAAERGLAERLIPPARLPAWAASWETILSDKIDAERLNLDRRALILRSVSRLQAVARG